MNSTIATRRGGTLRYSVGTCSLGVAPTFFLAAFEASDVCAILLGGSEAELFADLSSRFPNIELSHGEEHAEVLAQITALLDGTRDRLEVALVPQGTAFQLRVWQALRAVPSGSTTTYTQLAQTLGLPATAVRAVAGACAANPLAVAIPCHRVVRGDGGLAGYRWGVERKRILLQREADAALAHTGFVLTA